LEAEAKEMEEKAKFLEEQQAVLFQRKRRNSLAP